MAEERAILLPVKFSEQLINPSALLPPKNGNKSRESGGSSWRNRDGSFSTVQAETHADCPRFFQVLSLAVSSRLASASA